MGETHPVAHGAVDHIGVIEGHRVGASEDGHIGDKGTGHRVNHGGVRLMEEQVNRGACGLEDCTHPYVQGSSVVDSDLPDVGRVYEHGSLGAIGVSDLYDGHWEPPLGNS